MLRYAFNGLCFGNRAGGFNGMMGYWGTGNWIGMMVGGLIFLLFLLFLVILIVALFRRHGSGMHGGPMDHGQHWGGPGGQGTPGGTGPEEMHRKNVDSALAILNERYAKGEINQEEYLAKKNDLMK